MPDTSTEPGTRAAILEMIRTGSQAQRGMVLERPGGAPLPVAGRVPTMHQMACWLGITAKNVHRHVRALERDGRVVRQESEGRALTRTYAVVD